MIRKLFVSLACLSLCSIVHATTYTVIVDDQTDRVRTVWEECVGYVAYGIFGKQGYLEGACASSHQDDFQAAAPAPSQFYYVMLFAGSPGRYLRKDCVLQRFTMNVGDAPDSGQVFVACGFPAK